MLKISYIPGWLTELQEYRGKEKGGKEGREGSEGCYCIIVNFLTISSPKNRNPSLESSGLEQSREGSCADV